MQIKKYVSMLVASMLMVSVTACSPKPPVQTQGKDTPKVTTATQTATQKNLAATIQAKYGDATPNYIEAEVLELGRSDSFEVDLGFKLQDEHNTYDMFQFFADPELTIPLKRPAPNEYLNDDTTVLIEPGDYGFYRTEFEGGTPDWGNLNVFYLAKYYDSKGNVTEEPQSATKIKIKTELARPNVQVSADELGLATLSWEAVPGATEYGIYTTYVDENTGNLEGDDVLLEYATTDKTTFTGFQNSVFDTSYITGRETNGITSANIDFRKDSGLSTGFVVIAYGSNGEKSAISRLINPEVYSQLLPYARPYATEQAEVTSDKYLNLPYFMPVEMCDGTIVQYPVTYDINSIEEDNGAITSLNLTLPGEDVTEVMTIMGRAKGTPFENVYYFRYTPSKETPQDVINQFLERQAQVVPTVSGTNGQVVVEEVSKEEVVQSNNKPTKTETPTQTETPAKESITIPEEELNTEVVFDDSIPVYATNAFSEYLATYMISGANEIDVSAFPKSNDINYLTDAFMEALYQNPYIFGVTGLGYDDVNQVVFVTYTESRSEQVRKQKELLKAVQVVTSNIILPNMDELQKERAINDYLCNAITYDMAALENGESHNYEYVDEEFNDSFTAYGALINDVCVCKGYAEAFALLAREAGLDAIVVTGMVGNVGHAWNKVQVNQEWLVVDSTNNDSPVIPNAIFNLPVSIANQVIVEDKDYLLDSELGKYVGESLHMEYYRLTESYRSYAELQDYLVDELLNPNVSTILVRTDFEVTDDDLAMLVRDAVSESGISTLSDAALWYGVVYIEK